MKISYSILLSFIFILALFSITTYINYKLSNDIKEDTDYLGRSTVIIRNSGRFQRNILNMVSGLRGYLLTGEKSFIEAYDAANSENDGILQELPQLLSDSSQSQLLREIKSLNDQWTDEYTEPLKQAKALSSISDTNLRAFNGIYRGKFATGDEAAIQAKLQEKFRDFAANEYRVRNARRDKLTATVNSTKKLSLVLTGISVITAILVVAFLVSTISKRIGKMTGMANAIAAGNYDVHVDNPGNDELSSLGQSLNEMASKLSKNISLLKRSNEELDQFAHIASHDLKGPLRGIGMVVEWIEEDHGTELSPKLKEYIELIKGRIRRAENLIEGILSYARIDKEELVKEEIDVNDLIAEVLDNLAKSRNVLLHIDKMPVVFAEKILLYQVFSNLIDNAIKYNDKPHPQVSIYYEDKGSFFEFFIKDNGIGIAENHHKRIYEIFQTLVDKDSFESTGVGLAIVKKILDSKRQSISLDSQPGIGSVFSFTWPKE